MENLSDLHGVEHTDSAEMAQPVKSDLTVGEADAFSNNPSATRAAGIFHSIENEATSQRPLGCWKRLLISRHYFLSYPFKKFIV